MTRREGSTGTEGGSLAALALAALAGRSSPAEAVAEPLALAIRRRAARPLLSSTGCYQDQQTP